VANDEFREDQESRRQFGKAKQHEKRLERAVRKRVAEEIALAIEGAVLDLEQWSGEFYVDAARIIREIGSRDPE
jgi:hypothetical protein